MALHIAFRDSAALRGRCQYAQVRTTHRDAGYEDGAVVPDGPWLPVTEEITGALSAAESTAPETVVEIVRPWEAVGGELGALTVRLGDPDAVYLGQSPARADMVTTTDNHADGRLLGIHLDNWDKLAYADKASGRRRLCLNLGRGSRYILLGDVDAQEICRSVHPEYRGRYPHTDDLRTLIGRGGTMRCFRIRIDPGEGYIAPTEFLPHDGSTAGLALPSTAAFWLGRWPVGVVPSVV
ncbi:hypothetical protein OTB20_25585 [Streptomyces sp. H27-H1]|uniref:hypothetical protein n=1 Tax=unclassified Streptomyces TaxID=2593676 RepID=UPI0022702C22|nr:MULTISPECIES: hypothetical protein [unclassified Streptomyces]MCY0929512.1 hypothetical protein [Streptomyces sp. H27-H1]MCY0939657.1 hypothetical protein [Streptomyces sp. H34-S4]